MSVHQTPEAEIYVYDGKERLYDGKERLYDGKERLNAKVLASLAMVTQAQLAVPAAAKEDAKEAKATKVQVSPGQRAWLYGTSA